MGKGESSLYSEYKDSKEDNIFMMRIESLIENYKIDEAEFLVLKHIKDDVGMDTALWFYERINELSDDELELSGFKRERILKGIKNICISNNLIDANTIDFLINSEK